MGIISVFNFISLDGYYKDKNNDIRWHSHDPKGEEGQFSEENSSPGNTLLFGRVTYEMMRSFWPTKQATEQFPKTAEGMNKSEKIVFSKTLKNADWENTKIISDNIEEKIKKLKETRNMTILGSGSILTQLTDVGLVDKFQFLIDPIVLGEGTLIFKGIKNRPELKLVSSREFKSGAVLHVYEKK